jgi:Fe-S-cluster containining protein
MTDRAIVPCGSCHLCCKLHTPLLPEKGDRIEEYDWAKWIDAKTGEFKGFILWRVPDGPNRGDCIYLTKDGCSIWERAPYTCRHFDCRETFRNSDRQGRKLAIKRGTMPKEIFERGRELLSAEIR